MKKNLCAIFAIISLQISNSNSQTVSTFEELTLPPDSFWNGSNDAPGATFSSGNAIFPNVYNTTPFPGYWERGWAYSNMKDSTTAGYTNMYSAVTAIGNNNSAQYAICQIATWIGPEKLYLNNNAIGKVVNGFYITNSTYAALSMRDGDGFAKKFGGATGDDPDWFKLTIHGWYNGNLIADSVEFYLADYRFSDNAQDYIVKNWQWVDLTSLGNTDSLQFNLSSSDNGQFGMNTPAFFCMDDFTTSDNFLLAENFSEENFSLDIFPNPNHGNFMVRIANHYGFTKNELSIYNILGEKIYAEKIRNSPAFWRGEIRNLSTGIYFLQLSTEKFSITKKIIIE